jgi:hypothetical protein
MIATFFTASALHETLNNAPSRADLRVVERYILFRDRQAGGEWVVAYHVSLDWHGGTLGEYLFT